MSSTRFLLTFAALAVFSGAALGAEPRGPEIGNNKYRGEISDVGIKPDRDDYVGRLIQNELLTVTLTSNKSRGLPVRGKLSVIDPSGNVALTVDPDKKGKARVKKLVVTETGTWTVRVEGENDTSTGDYQVVFKVKKPKPVKFKKVPLGGAAPTEVDQLFPGIADAQLTLTLVWPKKGPAVQLRALLDPAGGDVPSAPGQAAPSGTAAGDVVYKKNKGTLKRVPLQSGDGSYVARLGIDEGETTFNLKLKVDPVSRINNKKPVDISSIEDPFVTDVPMPKEGSAGDEIMIEGRNFSGTVQDGTAPLVFFDETQGTVVAVDRNTLTVVVPVGPDGEIVDLTVVNAGPPAQADTSVDYFKYIDPVVVNDVTIAGGAVIGGFEVPIDGGGNTVTVTGLEFQLVDTVSLGGVLVTLNNPTATSFEFDLPAATSAGTKSLTITDTLGRNVVEPDVVHYVGFIDSTSIRMPPTTTVDDYSAHRGVLGDLDGDGRSNDLVIGSYNEYAPAYDGSLGANLPGIRLEMTRQFHGGTQGIFSDRNNVLFPSVGSDTPGIGDWNARAVALGDVDDNGSQEILVAGGSSDGSAYDFPRLRVFRNSGGGSFTLDELNQPPSGYYPAIEARTDMTDDDGNTVYVIVEGERIPQGTPTSMVAGDVDGDGDDDVIVGHDSHGYRSVDFDLAYIDTTQTPYYSRYDDLVPIGEYRYYAATRLFENDPTQSPRLVDVTEAQIPFAGTQLFQPLPSFVARDLVLGDIDGDTDLDLIVTWNNPNSTTPAGAATYSGYYSGTTYRYPNNFGYADPQVATRILENDGYGNFEDQTHNWLPAAAAPEFWHGHRVELADLDNDTDLDLIILHRKDLARFGNVQATFDRHSLRILRNDGEATGFVEVTTTALPPLPTDSNDNLRGNAISVIDVNADGFKDILVGTRERLIDDLGQTITSTRLLLGKAGLEFDLANEFLPGPSLDSGEVSDIVSGTLTTGISSVILLSENTPQNSTDGAHLRIFDWGR